MGNEKTNIIKISIVEKKKISDKITNTIRC
jgi:hypothetical protein